MREDKLKEALIETYDVFNGRNGNGRGQIVTGLKTYLRNGNPNYFTRGDTSNGKKGSRDIISKIDRKELADYLADFVVDVIAKIKKPESISERYIIDIVQQELKNGMSENEVKRYVSECILGKRNGILNYTADNIIDVATKTYSDVLIVDTEARRSENLKNAHKSINPRYGVKNLRANPTMVNYCVEEVLNGNQIRIQNDVKRNRNSKYRPARSYNLNDEMFAYTDIGNVRDNQEDSVLIMYHPNNEKYKMLVVADGMGGLAGGENASNEAVKEIIDWFSVLRENYMQKGNEKFLQAALDRKIKDISKSIADKFYGSGTTFVGAIVGEQYTLIASVGDSRAYVLDNDYDLHQLTVDDNPSFKYWKADWKDVKLNRRTARQMEEEKDYLRFKNGSNAITDYLGRTDGMDPKVKFSLMPNDLYKTLMLFSDGVTDCLSDKEIKAITATTDPKKLAETIARQALSKDSIAPEKIRHDKNYKDIIRAGKDNTTVALITKKDGEER